jgi:hypothetical protein
MPRPRSRRIADRKVAPPGEFWDLFSGVLVNGDLAYAWGLGNGGRCCCLGGAWGLGLGPQQDGALRRALASGRAHAVTSAVAAQPHGTYSHLGGAIWVRSTARGATGDVGEVEGLEIARVHLLDPR